MFPSGSYYAPIAAVANAAAGVQKLTISGSSVSTTALNPALVGAVEICSSTDCFYRLSAGASTATVNDTYLPAGSIVYRRLQSDQTILSFIQSTAGGFVTVTPVYS
jgi:hypothetical protein